jgi:hypothetical protein
MGAHASAPIQPPPSAAKSGKVGSPLPCIIAEKEVPSGDSRGIKNQNDHIPSDHEATHKEAGDKSSGLNLSDGPEHIDESEEFNSADEEYDSEGDAETLQSGSHLGESPEEIIRSIVSILEEEMIACVMKDIYGMLDPNGNIGIRNHAGSREYSNSTSPAFTPGKSSDRRRQKRRLDGEGSSGSGDDQEDDRGKRPRQKDKSSSRSQIEGCRFACPFYKHDAEKYQANTVTGSKYRVCAGPGWTSIHRVK